MSDTLARKGHPLLDNLTPRQAIRDGDEVAKTRAYVRKRFTPSVLGSDPLGRDYGLVIDALLFDAVVVGVGGEPVADKPIPRAADLKDIKLGWRTGIERPRFSAPRPWAMDGDALGKITDQAVARGLPFLVRVHGPNTVSLTVGPLALPERSLTITDGKWIGGQVVKFMATYLLANEHAVFAPAEYAVTEADLGELFAAHSVNKKNQEKAARSLSAAVPVPLEFRTDPAYARQFALNVLEGELFDKEFVTKGDGKRLYAPPPLY